jgi:hypothetical protein
MKSLSARVARRARTRATRRPRATQRRCQPIPTRGSWGRGVSRAGPMRVPSASTRTSLGVRIGVRRARRRKTPSALAQPPNLHAARPGARDPATPRAVTRSLAASSTTSNRSAHLQPPARHRIGALTCSHQHETNDEWSRMVAHGRELRAPRGTRYTQPANRPCTSCLLWTNLWLSAWLLRGLGGSPEPQIFSRSEKRQACP